MALLPIMRGVSAISVLIADKTMGQFDDGDSVRPKSVKAL
jgi:hypothetical protein